jgi:hypothetical protein
VRLQFVEVVYLYSMNESNFLLLNIWLQVLPLVLAVLLNLNQLVV